MKNIIFSYISFIFIAIVAINSNYNIRFIFNINNNIVIVNQKAIFLDSVLAEFGHRIFFDKNFSANGTKSCASCHAPELAFTDGYRRSLGIEADLHAHNAPSLINVGALRAYNWANPTVTDLITQVQLPLFHRSPKELGLQAIDSVRLFAYLRTAKPYAAVVATYRDSLSWQLIGSALKAYLQGLTSSEAKYFEAESGSYTFTAQEAQGKALFFSDDLKCAYCHSLPYFTNASWDANAYYNIGLYRNYPPNDLGLYHTTHRLRDKGKFRVPSLYNVALTAPYMHDGSVATLGEVIDIFARGGRNLNYGAQKGDGKYSKNKHKKVNGFRLSTADRSALIAFLHTLTDTSFLQKPYFKPPVE